MWKLFVTIEIWLIAFVCVRIMKKIEPDNKIYPIWVLFITSMFTAFAVYDWLSFF